MVMGCKKLPDVGGDVSVLALSSRFDGPMLLAAVYSAIESFSTRSVESF